MPPPISITFRILQLTLYQDAEKARQHRSRIVQILNVPLRVRLWSSLAAALLTAFLSILQRVYHVASQRDGRILQTNRGVKRKGQESSQADTTFPLLTDMVI
jgi:hypothetical protein